MRRHRHFVCKISLALLISASCAFGQSAANSLPDANGHSQSTHPAGTDPIAERSLQGLPAQILRDQGPIWEFPLHAARGRHWIPAAGFVLATTGLVLADPHVAPTFRRTSDFHEFNRIASGRNTSLAMAAVPLTTYFIGRLHHNSFAAQTALLAGEAVADSELLDAGMKMASRRLRPGDIPPNGDFGHTWFNSNQKFGLDSGFPSGHTIAAFSIATVFAERYGRHRWVPWVAYGAATLVGFSRVSLQAHFPSDVFAGAVLGYSLSHFVVLRPR